MNSRLQILLRKEYQCRVFVVYKKIKKEKNRQNKNKANFSIFNQKEIKVTKTKH